MELKRYSDCVVLLTYAVSRPHAEGHVCERLNVSFVLWQEAVRDKRLGVWPVMGVVMDAPDGKLDQVTRLEGQVSAWKSATKREN